MKKVIYTISAIALLAACAPKTAEVIEVVEVETETFPNAEVAEGSQLYMDHCGKCHKHKTVTDYTQDQWKKIVPNMAAKSRLDATQENKVLQFVLWQTEGK
jgi:predicted transglutaminase-like cysteine proteinase